MQSKSGFEKRKKVNAHSEWMWKPNTTGNWSWLRKQLSVLGSLPMAEAPTCYNCTMEQTLVSMKTNDSSYYLPCTNPCWCLDISHYHNQHQPLLTLLVGTWETLQSGAMGYVWYCWSVWQSLRTPCVHILAPASMPLSHCAEMKVVPVSAVLSGCHRQMGKLDTATDTQTTKSLKVIPCWLNLFSKIKLEVKY